MKFETSAAVTRSDNNLISGWINKDGSTRFCQWVADNFGFNKYAITGEDTNHIMGIISCISPKSDQG